jgi:hypothetical protein
LANTTVAIISAVSRVISGLAARDQARVVYQLDVARSN